MSDVAKLKELTQFLRDRNPQVRQIALANLLGHTPKGSPHRDIFYSGLRSGGLKPAEDSDIIRDLKLLCRDQLATAHDAFRALVNLSDTSVLIGPLSEPTFLKFLVSYILNPDAILADLASMLLSNMTATGSVCNALSTLTVSILPNPASHTKYFPVDSRCGTCTAPVPYPSGEPREVPALPLLADAFAKAASVGNEQDREKRLYKGDLHFLASVLANLTTVPTARMFFLIARPSDPLTTDGTGDLEYPLVKLLAFTEHKDTIRRGGVASAIKNCAFVKEAHRALLTPDTERVAIPPSTVEAPGIDILPYVLLPLAGPEEYDLEEQELLPEALQFLPPTKTREVDPAIRLTHIETLLLLCTTRWGREYLRAHGVYEVVRALHLSEQVENIAEHVVRLVNFLKRDEGPETLSEEPDAAPSAEAQPESDDEDSKIEEI